MIQDSCSKPSCNRHQQQDESLLSSH
ncbi:MAG: hypothetical protein E7073_05875 [Bacteroidales bacterium]|nr:hypothetical protein [Bacteroidales bacterium]